MVFFMPRSLFEKHYCYHYYSIVDFYLLLLFQFQAKQGPAQGLGMKRLSGDLSPGQAAKPLLKPTFSLKAVVGKMNLIKSAVKMSKMSYTPPKELHEIYI